MAFDLKAVLRLDSAQFSRGLKDAQKSMGTLGSNAKKATDGISSSTGKLSSSLGKIGSLMAGAFAFDTIKNAGQACLEAAASAQALDSQFSQVFSGIEGDASKSLAEAAKSTGLMESQMKGSFTQIASFAKTTGMSTEDALSLSERAMVVAADSAAFYDRSLGDVTNSLQSFLKGNYENDAALGLSCTEVTRNAAANKLYGKSFKELSEEQKQLALLSMVEDANKLSGALGQSARESGSYQAQMDKLSQTFTDIKAKVGGAFLEPAVNAMARLSEYLQKVDVDAIIEKIKNFASYFEPTFSVIGEVIGDIINSMKSIGETEAFASIMDGVKAVLQYIKDNGAEVAAVIAGIASAIAGYNLVMGILQAKTKLMVWWQGALNTVMNLNPIALVVAAIAALVAMFVVAYKKSDTFREFVNKLWEKLKEGVSWIKDKALAVFDSLKEKWDKIKEVFESVKEKFTGIVDAVKNFKFPEISLPKWVDKALELASATYENVKDAFSGDGDGGNTPHNAGGWSYIPSDGLRYLHKGERVLTPEENKAYSNGAMGGVHIGSISIEYKGTGNFDNDADKLMQAVVRRIKTAGGAGA